MQLLMLPALIRVRLQFVGNIMEYSIEYCQSHNLVMDLNNVTSKESFGHNWSRT